MQLQYLLETAWEARFVGWIEDFLVLLALADAQVLFLTIPLSFIQGLFSIFPFAAILLVHLSVFGLLFGFLISWVATSVAAFAVFMLCRYFFHDWFQRRWGERLLKYDNWQHRLDVYGASINIILRTVPIIPNNLLAFMASISPMKPFTFAWSTLLGNIAHLALYGLLSASVLFPVTNIRLLWFIYLGYLAILLILCSTVIFCKKKSIERSNLASSS